MIFISAAASFVGKSIFVPAAALFVGKSTFITAVYFISSAQDTCILLFMYLAWVPPPTSV